MEHFSIEKVILIYNKYIYDRYKSLIDSGKTNELLTNNDLAKIFEYYSCIMLMNEYKQKFYEYDDINPDFKELHQMSRTDTGIDACNLIDTIVQCKLRQSNTNLNWKECATFFGSNVYTNEDDILSIRWKKMIITRNSDCNLSKHFDCRKKSFKDKTYDRNEMITYCKTLLEKPPLVSNDDSIQNKITFRDYQIKCKNLIMETKANLVICLPTGTGKNLIILHSLKEKTKYLILVPRIILMEQIRDDLKVHFPKLSRSVQCIGDGENVYDDKKYIYICVYNSINVVKEYAKSFEKIFIDEAHHIKEPEIYLQDDNNEEIESSEDVSRDELENNESGNDEDNLEDDNDNDNDDEEQDLENPARKNNDEKDEVVEDVEISKSFIDEISSLSRYNNVVYLSATIDIQEGITYYKKDLREMIEKKYLCDYTIHIPIFNDDPTNKSVCKYLIKNYRNIIIYCNSQKEGNIINKLMNTILKGCCEYIDCNTGKIKRNKILKEYKEGKIPFLVNVRILVEGFNAHITKGVVFMHLPSNSKTLIQIIGRCLRLHKEKTIANIILPFAEKGDEDSINNFLKVMAKNDSKIKKSYESKSLGGYISIDTVDDKLDDDEEDDEDDKEENNNSNDIELRFNMIFNSMGKMKNSREIFIKRLEELKKYIDENNKKPNQNNKDKFIKSMGIWIGYTKKNYDKKIHIMKDANIRKLWEEFINDIRYKKYMQLPSIIDIFNTNLNKLKNYIDINKKRPSEGSKDKDIKSIAQWIGQKNNNYIKKKDNMKYENIRKLWEEFINDIRYKEYILLPTKLEIFNMNLNKVKIYIDTNKKRPAHESKDKYIKSLGKFIGHCQLNYVKKLHNMKYENIYELWTNFINDEKYKKYFQLPTILEKFVFDLNKLKIYIDTNKIKPSSKSIDKNIKSIGTWIQNTQTNYIKKKEKMKYDNIRTLWENFINDEKYKIYFN